MSVHPLDDAQLDAQVEAILIDPAAATDSGLFEVRNKDRANRAVWKVGRIQAELAEAEALYKSERERLDAYITDERLRAEKAIEFLTALTAGYHAIVLEDDPKRKTIKLPAGDLVARQQPARWNIDDDQFIEWARANNHDELLNTKVTVDRPTVKSDLHVAPDGRAVDGYGEVVAGVTVTPGDVRFSVKPRVVDR